jgi:UDP-N-acetylmuramyl pentapeptide synthase
MSIVLALISILFLLKLLRDGLFLAWLWQVKEYRIDRMMSHLRENFFLRQTKAVIPAKAGIQLARITIDIILNNIFYAFAFVFYIISYLLKDNYILFFIYAVLSLFAFAVLQIIKEIKNRSLKRPKPTLKIILVFSAMIIFYSLFFATYWIPARVYPVSYYGAGMTKLGAVNMEIANIKMANIEVSGMIEFVLFIIIINPLVISLIILAIEPIFYFQKKKIIKRATEKMRELKKVKVIGITGSYGKTSTKEFLYAILKEKYKVVKTEGNNNTNIGVAYTVLNKVSDEYNYFICEMGAYKIGEIKEMCDIVKPEIGVLTGINNQHIDLFGSQENIVKGKFELIEALAEEGMAIINEKLKNQNEKLQFKVKNVKYFSLDSVENIKVCRDYAEFDFQANKKCHPELVSGSIGGLGLENFNLPKSMSSQIREHSGNNQKILKQVQNDMSFRLNLLGRHYIENVLSGIMVAERLGMSLDEIKNAVEKIRPAKYMMRKTEGLNGSIFIDDSYSANMDGVLAALDYLDEAYKDYKKIIVFSGIIELGKEKDEAHKKIYNRIEEVCDVAHILGITNHELRIMNKGCKFIFEKDFGKVAIMLRNNLDDKTVALFESRGAGAVMGKLKK